MHYHVLTLGDETGKRCQFRAGDRRRECRSNVVFTMLAAMINPLRGRLGQAILPQATA